MHRHAGAVMLACSSPHCVRKACKKQARRILGRVRCMGVEDKPAPGVKGNEAHAKRTDARHQLALNKAQMVRVDKKKVGR
eukprot:1043324-Pelagomonas_calceolata.AAC.2